MRYLKFFLICSLFISMTTGACDGDGCTCVKVGPSDVKKTGELVITVNALPNIVNTPEKKIVSVSYSGVLKSASGQGDTGETSFSRNTSYEITSGNINPQPGLSRKNLKFGTWEVTVQANNWTAKCEGVVAPNKGGDFQFTFPSATGNCN